uniref:F-box protein AT5G49610-like beta-propeller domain-containing protein n=1 Tax=Oryza brachyantha TaxID=4533 RepID=J3LBU6_ORYBR
MPVPSIIYKVYMLSMQSYIILVLDLVSMDTCFINLPNKVCHEQDEDLDLFWSHDFGVNIIHLPPSNAIASDFLMINWVLVDDISLYRGIICHPLTVFYVDVRRNIVEGVRGDIEGGALPVIHQLMMVWPCYLPSAGIDQGS